MTILLKAEKIGKRYSDQASALKSISLEIEQGEFTAIVGPSGSGKSTLLAVMSGLAKPSTGQVLYKENELTSWNAKQLSRFRRREMGQVFQAYHLLAYLTVEENITLGLPDSGKGYPLNELTDLLEIGDLLDRFPGQLSGGQQQRVAIARAIVKRPSILFCDEATGALDENSSKKVISLLHRIRKTLGTTILFVTHNGEIARTAQRVITMNNGQLVRDVRNVRPIAPEEMAWA
ncbi:ABC transporter ATP-binding protein [Saccharibacillus endophyticus]|uniref:ABC transporter ATP-binding protein n=1 Tax=Saccharibacillus endophyticus TaxID=2060666 RepID=A0ABQ1ZYM3_9BACL|nr:ABC transporter ATP-binding protein [Saccharibacillus endophyticus]GGH80448.1 ABC transporter ATP-binding protein [Saccharibacillus endophyticus]